MVQGVFSWVDLVATPIWLVLFYLIAYTISFTIYKDPELRRHFMLGMTVKFIGCLGFIAVYGFYYGNGDTFRYFYNSRKIYQFLLTDPSHLWTIISSTNLTFVDQVNLGMDSVLRLNDTSSNYTVVRFALIFGILTFNSYVASSLFFAFGSFIGIWALYRVVASIFPLHYKAVTIPILYLPSVFFWGSSMMKDSIVIGFLGLLTFGFYNLFFRRKRPIFYLFLVIFCVYILVNVKQYVIIAYMPALILWLCLGPINKLPIRQRWMIAPFLIIISAVIISILFPLFEQANKKYAIEQVMETAETTADYIHRTTPEGGSSYTLGEVSYTPMGMLVVFPRAVTVTLFQPFLYEVRNPVMLLSALESTLFLLGTFFVIFTVGPFRFSGYIFNNPFLLMCLVFSVIFAFAVGISTFNYGSLVRYKIPCLPMYGISIMIPYMLNRQRIRKLHQRNFSNSFKN